MNWRFACISWKYPQKASFSVISPLLLLKCKIRPDQHLDVLGLETYLNFQLKIPARSLALRRKVTEFYSLKSSHSAVAGVVGFWQGFFFFLLVHVAFFCGRYAQKRTPNNTVVQFSTVQYSTFSAV